MACAEQVFNMVLKPVTPIHVWSGVRGYVGLDVVLDETVGECCVVDHEGVQLDQARVWGLLEGKLTVREVIEDAYRARSVRCRRRVRLDTWQPPKGFRELMLINDLLIPGSTLKGYIRTAILAYLLVTDLGKKGAGYVVEAIDKGLDLSSEPKSVSQGLEALYLRAPRRAGGFVDALQALSVSDPLAYSGVALSARDAYVYEVTGARVSRVLLETLDRGSIEYRLAIRKRSERWLERTTATPRLADVLRLLVSLELCKRETLLEVLRMFAKDVIEAELELVRRSRNALAAKAGVDLSKYEGLLNRLADLASGRSGCVPVRLGFMTGHMSKTVDGVIKRVHNRKYVEICSTMSRIVGRTWDSATIKLVWSDGSHYGLGWAELCLS